MNFNHVITHFLGSAEIILLPLPKLVIFCFFKIIFRDKAIQDERILKACPHQARKNKEYPSGKMKREKYTVVPATRKMALLRLPDNRQSQTHYQ